MEATRKYCLVDFNTFQDLTQFIIVTEVIKCNYYYCILLGVVSQNFNFATRAVLK